MLGEAANPRRAITHGHANNALEQRCGNDQVGLLAGQIQAQAAHGLEQQIEEECHANADGQHPQGSLGLVGHHAVVDIHDKQRRGQANQVDQHAGRQRIGIQPARALEGIAEPGPGPRNQLATRHIEAMARLGKETAPDIVLGQQGDIHQHLAPLAFAGHDARLLTFETQQQRTAAVLEQQQCRHGQRGNLLQAAPQPTPLQAGARRCTRQQLGAQALLRQRQPGGQHRATHRLLVQRTQ